VRKMIFQLIKYLYLRVSVLVMPSTDSLKNGDCYVVGQSQLLSVLRDVIPSSFNDGIASSLNDAIIEETKKIRKPQKEQLPFTDSEVKAMKLPQLKYEVQTRKLRVVGTGKGGAAKKVNYRDALLGRQTIGKVIRPLDQQ